MENFEVIWSGEIEKKMHDAQVRPAPEIPATKGSTGKAHIRVDGPRPNEERAVLDLRNRWQVPTKV